MAARRTTKAAKEEALSLLFQALADPSRRKIIALLREAEELRVGDIAQAFNISLNAVSKHLKVLERAGIVERRREGTTHFISMRWEALAPIVGWLQLQQHFWGTRLDGLEAYLTKGKKK